MLSKGEPRSANVGPFAGFDFVGRYDRTINAVNRVTIVICAPTPTPSARPDMRRVDARRPPSFRPHHPQFWPTVAPPALQLLSRSPPPALRAGSLPKVPAAQGVTFACFQNTQKSSQDRRKSCSNERKKPGKRLTGWQPSHQSANRSVRVLTLGRLMGSKFEFRGCARATRARSSRRPVPEILTASQLVRPLPALQVLSGASCLWANC